MLHIRPVLEKDASEEVKKVYKDIQETLHIHFVPLLFQYVAGFEEYFLYSWEKIKTNLTSDYYQRVTDEILIAARKSIHIVYKESQAMHSFITKIHPLEKNQILQIVEELEVLNANLLILSIGLREGVKGVVIGQQFLPHGTGDNYEETIFDQFINEKIMHKNLKEQQELAPAAKMLAPLFGSQSLVISHYPSFFAHIAQEMEDLTKSEKYLHERVAMEQKALNVALHLSYPLGCSYAELAQFAGKKPYFNELLYVLSETFPTQFPRLVFTSAVMEKVLQENQKQTLSVRS